MSVPVRTDRHSDRLSTDFSDFSDFRWLQVKQTEINRGNPKISKVTQQSAGPFFVISGGPPGWYRRWEMAPPAGLWACYGVSCTETFPLKKVSNAEYGYSTQLRLNLFIRVVWPNNVPLRCFFHLSYGVLFHLTLSPIFAFLSFSLLLLLLLLTLPICWFQFLIHLFPIFPSHEYLQVLCPATNTVPVSSQKLFLPHRRMNCQWW